MLRKLLCCFIILVFVSFAVAQEEVKDEKIDLETYKKTASVEVHTAQELIKQTNAENVGESLKGIPGVYIRSGLINIRDAVSNKVLVLLDGQRMNVAQSGEFEVETLPIDIIEKIEVLRGGNSARFGADAVGGVVNIITKKTTADSKMNIGLRGTYGSFNSQVYNIFTSKRISNFNYYVSYKRTQSDGDFEYKNLAGEKKTWENNDSKANDAMLKLGYDFTEKANLTFTTQVTRSESGVPGLIISKYNQWASLTPNARLENNNNIFNLSYKQQEVFGKADIEVRTYMHKFQLIYEDPDYWSGPKKSDHKNEAIGMDLNQNNALSEMLTLTYGYGFRQDKVNSNEIGERDRTNHSAHLSGTLQCKDLGFLIDNISFIPAVRYDAPSDFDAEFSPKLSLIFANKGGFSLSTDYGQSYRAPSFNDLYWPDDGYTKGNPDLKPEKGKNFDVGMSYGLNTLGMLNLKVNYFYSDMKDKIVWAPRATDFYWVPSNVAKSISKGVESYISWEPLGKFVKLELNHTYLDARDKSEGATKDKLLIYRPYNKMDVNLHFAYHIFEINVNHQWLSKRYIDTANTYSLGPVDVTNFNIGAQPKVGNLALMTRFEVNNVTDRSYQLNDGTPLPGIEMRFTLGLNY